MGDESNRQTAAPAEVLSRGLWVRFPPRPPFKIDELSGNDEPLHDTLVGHRDQAEMLKDVDTDFPEPGSRASTAARTARPFSLHKLRTKGGFLLGACFLSVLPGAAAPDNAIFHCPPFSRTTLGRHTRRYIGQRFRHGHSGGNKLTLKGSFSGLLGVPTSAHLLMGSLPGVRGPLIADLTVSPATSGTLSGTVQLNPQQLAALRKGGSTWRSTVTRRPRATSGAG